MRDRRTRAALRRLPPAERIVVASTWDFPNPAHAYVYQELLGFLGQGLDVRVMIGERRPTAGLAGRFLPLVDRTVFVETLASIHERDRVAIERAHPGRIDAFLRRVAEASGRSRDDLLRDPLVRRAFTFTRLVELLGARYLQSWFFYDQSFLTMFASQVLGIPRGISCHIDHVLADHPLKLVPLQLETADLVLAISERTADELVERGGPSCREKILVKRIGVDGSHLTSLRRDRVVDGSFELVSVCRLEPKKGLLTLVDAVDALRRRQVDVRVRLVGGPDPEMPESTAYADRLRRRIDELDLGDRIAMEGALEHDRIPSALEAAHAFVAPYVEIPGGDKDGIPTSMVEAMAAGLPLVCSAVGAIGEVVFDEREGLLVRAGDADALARAIERLAGDSGLRRRLSAAAAARFDREFDCRVTDRELHARVRKLLRAQVRSSAP